MIANLKPYPAAKDSGVPWLGEVPAHWEIRKLRHLLRRRTERGRPDLPLLSVVRENGVVLRDIASSDGNHNYIPDDLTAYKVVRAGQFVMNKMKAWQGSFGVSRYEGIVSPAYFVFDLSGLTGDYFHAATRSRAYVPAFTRASDGVRIGQWDLAESRMREIPFLVPSIADQAAIVRFLDHIDRRIRRYIRAKQKLIKLLEEQKQAVTHQAVTRGLDPGVRLKPSGVEWLEDVPEHWEVRAFSRCASERADYRGATPAKTDSGVFLVTARNVRRGWIDYDVSREFVLEAEYAAIMRRGVPKLGDLLLTMEAPLGNAALVDLEHVALAQRVVRFRFAEGGFSPRFVMLSVLSPYFQHQLLSRGTGSTALGIKASKLPQLRLLVPPRSEQQTIVEAVDVQNRPIQVAVDRALAEINLLHELRTRLIADVVTGKLDVREAAARLADEADEPDASSDVEEDVEAVDPLDEELEPVLEEVEA